MTPKELPRIILKRDQNMLREADKVRTVLIMFAGMFLMATPVTRLPEETTAWAGLAVAAIATLITRFFVNWDRLEAQNRLQAASGLVLLADLAWLMLFIAGTGGFASPFSMLLMVVILFAGIFFGSLPLALPLVTLTVVAYLTFAATRYGVEADTTWELGGQLITAIALGWLCYALTAVLERERQTNAHVIARLNQGLLLVDDHGFMVMANARASQLLGVELEDYIGRQICAFAGQDDMGPMRRVSEDALGESREYTLRPLELEGDPPRDLRIHTIPCCAGGQMPVGWIVLMEDVTDLHAALRQKEESLAIASHELRSPLATLRGVSHVLVTLGGGLTDEQKSKMLHALSSEILRLSEVVTKLLDVSSLEREAVTLEAETMEPEMLINTVAATLWQRAASRLIEVRCDLPPELPEVFADRIRLRMALGNLAENALKYTPDGGAITFTASYDEHTLRLAVTDTGVGIAQEEQAKIFDRYSRGSARQGPRGSGVIEGLGLGLYVTRRIIEMHGGSIKLQSQVGVGSTFEISLPLGQANAPALEELPETECACEAERKAA